MTDIPAIDTEMLARIVGDALHPRVGPKRPISDVDAAAELGVDVRSIRLYRLARQSPKAATLLRMFVLWGPDFANDVLAAAGLHCQPLEEGDANEFELNKQTADLMHEMADALEDGKIDHLERRRIQRKAKDLLPKLTAYIKDSEPAVRLVRPARQAR